MNYMFRDLIRDLESWNHKINRSRYWPFSEGPLTFVAVGVFVCAIIIVFGQLNLL